MSHAATLGNKRRLKPKSRKSNRFKGGRPGNSGGSLPLFGAVKKLTMLVAACAFILALGLGLIVVHRWMTTNDYFALKEIEVTGNVRLNAEDVLATGGLTLGANSLAVNMAEVEGALLADPWIEAVVVKRVLPGRMEVAVREITPVFWVRQGDRLFYADASGRAFAEVSADRFVSLPFLSVKDQGRTLGAENLEEFVKRARARRLPFGLGETAWVRLTPVGGVEAYLDGPSLLVRVGPDDFKANLKHLAALWEDLERRRELVGTEMIETADGKGWAALKQGRGNAPAAN